MNNYNIVVAALIKIPDTLESSKALHALDQLKFALQEVRSKAAPCGYDSGDSGIFEIANKALNGL